MRCRRPVSRAVIAALVAGTAAACASLRGADIQVERHVAFSLGENQSVTVAGTQRAIRVTAIRDSRCPSDVTCITAGDALVILVTSDDGTERTDTLHLRAAPRSAALGPDRVELLDVTPYPRSTARDRVPVAVLRVP
jgi:hypothetical protein